MAIENGEIKKQFGKWLVEESYQFMVGDLGKHLLMAQTGVFGKSGMLPVTDGCSVLFLHWQVIISPKQRLHLSFVRNNTLRFQMVDLDTQQIKYGIKIYFLCACGKRCLKLYGNPRFYGFGCRACQFLRYSIQEFRKGSGFLGLKYLLNRKQKIQLAAKRVKREIYAGKLTRRAMAVMKMVKKYKITDAVKNEFRNIS